MFLEIYKVVALILFVGLNYIYIRDGIRLKKFSGGWRYALQTIFKGYFVGVILCLIWPLVALIMLFFLMAMIAL